MGSRISKSKKNSVGNKEFGAYLKRLRLLAGLTQEDAAKASDVSVPYISLLERGGKSQPSRSILERLAKAYGADFGQLLIHAGHDVIPEDVLADAYEGVPFSGFTPKGQPPIKQVEEIDFSRPISDARLNWAVAVIYSDPDFKTVVSEAPEELSDTTKKLLVEMYQQATGRRLLTRGDNLVEELPEQEDNEPAA